MTLGRCLSCLGLFLVWNEGLDPSVSFSHCVLRISLKPMEIGLSQQVAVQDQAKGSSSITLFLTLPVAEGAGQAEQPAAWNSWGQLHERDHAGQCCSGLGSAPHHPLGPGVRSGGTRP